MAAKRTRADRAAIECTSGSVEETQTFGEQLGRALQPGDVVACYGELGSGKTTLIQGLARGLGLNPELVKSPTFVLQREYAGPTPIIHVDGYRLAGADDVTWLDVDLLFDPSKITVIEWAERFQGLLPDERLDIRFHHVSTNRRRLSVIGYGSRGEALRAALKAPPAREPSEPRETSEHGTVAGD